MPNGSAGWAHRRDLPRVVVVKHGIIAFHGATSRLAAQAAGLTWHLTRPAGAPGTANQNVSITAS